MLRYNNTRAHAAIRDRCDIIYYTAVARSRALRPIASPSFNRSSYCHLVIVVGGLPGAADAGQVAGYPGRAVPVLSQQMMKKKHSRLGRC